MLLFDSQVGVVKDSIALQKAVNLGANVKGIYALSLDLFRFFSDPFQTSFILYSFILHSSVSPISFQCLLVRLPFFLSFKISFESFPTAISLRRP